MEKDPDVPAPRWAPVGPTLPTTWLKSHRRPTRDQQKNHTAEPSEAKESLEIRNKCFKPLTFRTVSSTTIDNRFSSRFTNIYKGYI